MRKFSIKKARFISGCFLVLAVALVTAAYFSSEPISVTVSSKKDEPIYFGNRSSNKVALMFNCYEGTEIIKAISEELNKYGFKATFFFGGCFADDNAELLIFLAERGHEIANHGYFHKEHSKLTYEENLNEIKRTNEIILALSGVKANLFAPPSGDFSDQTLKACKNLGLKVIMWSKDTVDWRDKNQKTVYNRATQGISGGDFVLMHPKEHTLMALPAILEYYFNQGLTVSTVSDCME